MSLFVQSMIMQGWQFVEETKDSLLFTRNDGESSISLRLFAPYRRGIRDVHRHQRLGEYPCSFNVLPEVCRIEGEVNRQGGGVASLEFGVAAGRLIREIVAEANTRAVLVRSPFRRGDLQ